MWETLDMGCWQSKSSVLLFTLIVKILPAFGSSGSTETAFSVLATMTLTS